MRRNLLLCGISTALIAVSMALAVETGDGRERIIPLSEIISTSPQNELRSIQDVLNQNGNSQAASEYLGKVLGCSNGSSNVFLVDATTATDALAASSMVLAGPQTADALAAVDTSSPKRGSPWLVAYLGTGPSRPVKWTVERVSIHGAKVELRYRKSKPSPATEDAVRYYYWVPLGELSPNIYEVQLIDAEKNAVRLMRRVEVAL